MKNKGLKILSLSLLSTTLLISGCGCSKKVNINFIGDNGTIIKTITSGSNLDNKDIPQAPKQKGKYCIWDRNEFKNITSDINVNYTCYDSVSKLETNLVSDIKVTVGSDSASLEEILKNLVVTATLEDGSKKLLYKDQLNIDSSNYDKNKSGVQKIYINYNNKTIEVKINVVKEDSYVTAVFGGNIAYINEGLPTLYATTKDNIEGKIKFDDNQELKLATLEYKWTFVPEDTNKYKIVTGSSFVTVINASEITTNKSEEVFEFEYGTTKEDIISNLKQDLVVTGKFNNANRKIDEKYYTITSDYVIQQPKDGIDFVVNYGSGKYAKKSIIKVNVKKNSSYSLGFANMENNPLLIDENTTINDLLNHAKQFLISEISGELTLDDGQTVSDGNYSYKYTFKPSVSEYIVKRGTVKIKTKSLIGFESTTPIIEYDYNSKSKEEIKADIFSRFTGNLVYSDNSKEPINSSKIDIVIGEDYDRLIGKEYRYSINYTHSENKVFTAPGMFVVKKLSLKEGEDFRVEVEKDLDKNNYPKVTLISLKSDLDMTNFTLIEESKEFNETDNIATYTYKLIGNSDVNNKYYESVLIVKVQY